MNNQRQAIATVVEENDPALPRRCSYCYQRAYRIGWQWGQKVRCRRCPMCGSEILGLRALTGGIANDGSEVCSNRRCGYERQVFSVEEMEQKIFW